MELCDNDFTKPSSIVQFNDKNFIKQSLCLHHVILKRKAEIDQFRKGIQSLGTRDAVKKYPALLKEFFLFSDKKVLMAGEGIESFQHILELLQKLFITLRYSER